MTDPELEEIRRRFDAPVAPREDFSRSLLAKLECVLDGDAISAEEIDAQCGEELPLREAMSVIPTDPLGPVDLGAVLGNVQQPGTPDPTNPPNQGEPHV